MVMRAKLSGLVVGEKLEREKSGCGVMGAHGAGQDGWRDSLARRWHRWPCVSRVGGWWGLREGSLTGMIYSAAIGYTSSGFS